MPGIKIPIGRGIRPKYFGKSWQSYWATQSEVLFFGLYSEIAGGRMPNKVPGATDYLTVAGSAGSETYQVPNTAPYIAADTDYIWFKTDATQRTTTTAELIGYDLQRTPVKYNDTAPNAIVAIMILNAAVTGTRRDKMFIDFWLPIMWDNSWNNNGHSKSNRSPIEQKLWTPEELYPDEIGDGNTVAFYIADESADIIKDGSNRVALWKDHLGSGNDIAQAKDSSKPIWSADGVLCNGEGQVLIKAFTLIQPTTIYVVMRQPTWTAVGRLFDGNANNVGALLQYASTPGLFIRAGALIGQNNNLAVNTWGIVRIVFNGASSSLQINETAATTGDAGTGNMGGFSLGGYALEGAFGNGQYKEIIIRKVADAAPVQTAIYNYLKTKYSL